MQIDIKYDGLFKLQQKHPFRVLMHIQTHYMGCAEMHVNAVEDTCTCTHGDDSTGECAHPKTLQCAHDHAGDARKNAHAKL